MIGRVTSGSQATPLFERQSVGRLLWLVLTLLLTAAAAAVSWYAYQVVRIERQYPVSISSSLDQVSAPIRLETPLLVHLAGVGTEVQGARMTRTDALTGREQAIPVRLAPADSGAWQIVSTDGSPLLRTDGDYRLSVQIVAPRPALPMPRLEVIDRSYRFTTVASPRVRVPSEALQPRWAEPVSVTWTQPMAQVTVEVRPDSPARAWVDPADATRTWVSLGEGGAVADGQTYEVTFTRARSADGLDVQRPASFKVAVPARPRLVNLPSEPLTLRRGEGTSFDFSMDVANVDVGTTDGSLIEVKLVRSRVQVAFPEYRQGASFGVEVRGAIARSGAPLDEPASIRIQTPAAFAPPTIEPEQEAVLVSPSTRPRVTFAGPILDRPAAERALHIEPAVEGRWQWLAADRVEFVPSGRLPSFTDFTVTVDAGPDGVRNSAGGYLEFPVVSTFRTSHYKRIDVSLSRQVLTMLEEGKPIQSIRVATGVAGAETPLGTFIVQYKMPVARFRGVNPSGLRYDIPDVKWVLAFFEDYTIHGAYWRSQFGTPGSNGCVTMTESEAKGLYDWADVGVPITISS